MDREPDCHCAGPRPELVVHGGLLDPQLVLFEIAEYLPRELKQRRCHCGVQTVAEHVCLMVIIPYSHTDLAALSSSASYIFIFCDIEFQISMCIEFRVKFDT